ncbi:hypothetical protein RU86_GL001387 [Lactococcus piscium]|uniref:Uncharacterized protein n=2 Tax=Pseudolactococcus piscium TaxID=1364 RepID=A0A2A5RUQ8_9LACT|nr:hypothetical protein RU86_GL001387 [Lactococcus piscium]
MGIIQEDSRQVEEKLKKLYELDMKLAPLFSGITSELSNLTAVISAIGSGRFDSSGHFSMTCSKTDLDRMNKFLFAKGSKSESKKKHDNLDWKKIGKLIKGTASGTILSVTVSDVTLKIKASDLAKL